MHLSVQMLKLLAGIDMTDVAYRGSGPVALDVMSGQVPLGMLDLPSVLAQIKAGKVRALAVTGSTRLADLPDVPTLAEAGVKGYESTGWFGVVAPAATPPAVVARLQSELQAVLTDPAVLAQARAIGVELTPIELGRFRSLHRQRNGEVGRRDQALGHQARLNNRERPNGDEDAAGRGCDRRRRPVGLTLATDLAQRGHSVVVIETRQRGEPPNVKCNHVAARTMEQFRRLGVAQEVRDAGLPADYPNDVVFRTSVTGIELSRIRIPARRDALQRHERSRRLVAHARAAASHQPDLSRADPVRACRGASRA